MVAKDLNINEFYWGLKTKFKLEIGLTNEINPNYPDIIWFPQGIFVITSFNTNQSTNNFTVSISGKDKMCLLNGDLGGNLPASVDFGVKEYVDLEKQITTYEKIPIKEIIREAIHAYALEPYHNIIINDLDEAGLELLEYRGDKPMYLLYDINEGEYVQKASGTQICFINGEKDQQTTLDSLDKYFSRVDLISDDATKFTIILKEENNKKPIMYNAVKIEYGQTVGYHIIDLVYAGDLVSSIGETLTSILDKIKNMLGEFEYFYDVFGRFIFQRKKIYVNQSFNGEVNNDDYRLIENSVYNSKIAYKFEGGNLIASYQNNPNLQNLKNDFSIWGVRKSVSGAEIPIHYRFAIDEKPEKYTSIEVEEDDLVILQAKFPNVVFNTQESITYSIERYDWREIIYRMALDYYQYGQLDNFQSKIIEANREDGLYQDGTTGYEQYYIDIQGFWRELYNPEPSLKYNPFSQVEIENIESFDPNQYPDGIYTNFRYIKYAEAENKPQRKDVLVLKQNDNGRYELHPLLDTISFKSNIEYYTTSGKDKTEYVVIDENLLNTLEKKEIFVKIKIEEQEKYVPLIESVGIEDDWYYKESSDQEFYLFYKQSDNSKSWLKDNLKKLFFTESGDKIYTYIPHSKLDMNGKFISGEEKEPERHYIEYFEGIYDYILNAENNKYWNKNITDAPDLLNFWFDFLDSTGELSQFSVQAIGSRTKVINDTNIKSIYFREVPEITFIDSNQREQDIELINKSNYWHFTRIYGVPMNLFSISAQGKSAQDELESLLYNHSYCIEQITLSSVPVYYLEPNTRISVQDNSSKINGEYLISRISLPLTYNGMMSITATKAPTRLY